MDWAQYDKIHLSFVQHSGKPECKQLSNIEAALKVSGADSALYLCEAVLNGFIEAKRNASLEKQKQSGAKYAEPIFSSMGGTVAKRSKTGKCMFRQVTLSPGTSADYALQAVEAEGEETTTGGIAMKKGATVNRITVGIRREELMSMASVIKMAWQAYLINGGDVAHSENGHDDAPPPAAPAQKTEAPAPAAPGMAYVVYDSEGATFEVASTPAGALALIQQGISTMNKGVGGTVFKRRDNKDYDAAKAALQNGSIDDIPPINLYSADGAQCTFYVVCRQMHV